MEQTIRTRATDLLGIDHPVVLGGMGGGATPRTWSPPSPMPAGWA